MKTLLLHACALLALAASTTAEIIGVEQFDYADSAIAAKNGGTFWDYKNFAPTGHNGTASTWDNFTSAPVVTSGRLVTDNTSAKREYNGALESDGAVNDPASVPSSVAHTVYYRVTFTTGATLPSFISISSSDFGTDVVSFGVSMDVPNDNKFSFRIHPQSSISNSSTLAAPNTTYTLVAKLDYTNNVASLYLNPDLNAAEGSVTPLRTATFTATNWSTAVRLASGSGGAVAWDDLAVATTWDDLGAVVTTIDDEDNGSLVPTAGGGEGVSLREAVKYSPSGTLITFDSFMGGAPLTLTAGELAVPAARKLIVDASSLAQPVHISGGHAGRVFNIPAGATLTLKNLEMADGKTSGNGGAITNAGTLTLSGCIVSGSSADVVGGGIYTIGPLTLARSTLTDNTAGSGGGLWAENTSLLSNCTIAGNRSTTFNPSTGGIVVWASTLVTMQQCTVVQNVGRGGEGGIFVNGSGSLTIGGSIVAGNTDTSGAAVDFVAPGTIAVTAPNLIGSNQNVTGTFPAGALVGTPASPLDPKLSPPGYFGGPTLTMHPLIGSPAIDAGGTTDPGGTDQRGFARFIDGDSSGTAQLDIGAVEAGRRYSVGTPGDGGGDTLRFYLGFLASQPPGTRLSFDQNNFPANSITLNGTELSVPASLTGLFIDASNLSGPVTISGNNASRVFNIAAGASVAMHGLIITNGRAFDGANGPGGSGDSGGGISNAGSLSLFSCAITGNRSGNGGNSSDFAGSAGFGGGIDNNRGRLSLHACSVTGNVTGNGGNGGDSGGVGGAGGGISSLGFGASLRMTACLVSGNRTGDGGNDSPGGDGGGIASSGTLDVTGCTIADNQTGTGAVGGRGGGIDSSGFSSSFNLVSSTVSGNRTGSGSLAAGDGGGISLGGPANFRSSTITGNQADRGGGVEKSDDLLSLEHCTIAGNSASGAGGGIETFSSTALLTLRNSIVAGNTASTGPDLSGGAVTFAGSNLLGNPNGPSSITGPTPNVADPLLAPLADYGGPTFTMALKPGSPARNVAFGSTTTSDQRGFSFVGTPDLGAYEAGTFTNYNAFIWESLPATATPAQHATTFDFDGDGASNSDEWLAGTEPGNPASVFRVTQVTSDNGNVIVTFPSIAGRTYRFDVAFDLGNPTTWLPLVNGASLFTVPGTGAPLTVPLGAFPGQPRLFVRIHAGP